MAMTEDIAAFVKSFGLEGAPADLTPRARDAFMDSFGVMLAGSREESARIAARWVGSEGSNGTCTVFAHPAFVSSAANAALANGIAAHTLDFDHFGHQSAVMVPCVLAAAEAAGASGRSLMEGYIAGVELSTLLAQGMSKAAHELGLHPAGLCGSLGAAAAAAKILGLDTRQIKTALGIAASMSAGLSQNFGTMVKPLHLGNAARNGIAAVQLSALDFTANESIFDQPGGFFGALTPLDTERLGRVFRFLEPGIAFKAYPCPYSSQRAVDAIIKIAESHAVAADEVIEITCAAAPNTFRVLMHHRPSTSLEAKFSLEYLLACGLVFKTIDEDCFATARVNDPSLRALVGKVRLLDSSAERGNPGEGPVTVEVRTRDAVYQETVSYAPGHPKNPLSWERLAAKYRACARQGGYNGRVIAGSVDALQRIDEISSVRDFLRPFAVAGSS
jgi:2-methylcitrate dehydratase PrpD